jgi:hypothetical protein
MHVAGYSSISKSHRDIGDKQNTLKSQINWDFKRIGLYLHYRINSEYLGMIPSIRDRTLPFPTESKALDLSKWWSRIVTNLHNGLFLSGHIF